MKLLATKTVTSVAKIGGIKYDCDVRLKVHDSSVIGVPANVTSEARYK